MSTISDLLLHDLNFSPARRARILAALSSKAFCHPSLLRPGHPRVVTVTPADTAARSAVEHCSILDAAAHIPAYESICFSIKAMDESVLLSSFAKLLESWRFAAGRLLIDELPFRVVCGPNDHVEFRVFPDLESFRLGIRDRKDGSAQRSSALPVCDVSVAFTPNTTYVLVDGYHGIFNWATLLELAYDWSLLCVGEDPVMKRRIDLSAVVEEHAVTKDGGLSFLFNANCLWFNVIKCVNAVIPRMVTTISNASYSRIQLDSVSIRKLGRMATEYNLAPYDILLAVYVKSLALCRSDRGSKATSVAMPIDARALWQSRVGGFLSLGLTPVCGWNQSKVDIVSTTLPNLARGLRETLAAYRSQLDFSKTASKWFGEKSASVSEGVQDFSATIMRGKPMFKSRQTASEVRLSDNLWFFNLSQVPTPRFDDFSLSHVDAQCIDAYFPGDHGIVLVGLPDASLQMHLFSETEVICTFLSIMQNTHWAK